VSIKSELEDVVIDFKMVLIDTGFTLDPLNEIYNWEFHRKLGKELLLIFKFHS
jgi:hypothetical protein